MSSKNVDRLSLLPEEVLSVILSSMPTKFAVRTSILSKKWRYSWTLVTNLDFDDNHPFHDINCFSNFVDRVLDHCKTTQVKLFRLGFFEFWVGKSRLSKWIDEAVRLNVSELDIQVVLLKLPLSVLTCKTLTKLRLVQGTSYWDIWEWPSLVNLPCLKTLDINVFSKPFLNAFRLIRGCPVLESLFLQITHDECEEYNFNIPTLKRLKLTFLKGGMVKRVVLHLPNLEYLFFGGNFFDTLFVMEDLSSLVEASVSCTFYNVTLDHLLNGISGAKSLSWLKYDGPSTLPLPIFPNLNHLELKLCFLSGWLLILRFLENSNELQHLCIEEPEESCWVEPKSVPACILTNLTTIKFTKCIGRKCDIQFLEYMLGNAEVLKTLTITCENLRIEEEMQLCAQLLKFRRASRYCEIHFLGNWSR